MHAHTLINTHIHTHSYTHTHTHTHTCTHTGQNVPEYLFMKAPWYTVVILLIVVVVMACNCNAGNLKCSGYHEATLKAAY